MALRRHPRRPVRVQRLGMRLSQRNVKRLRLLPLQLLVDLTPLTHVSLRLRKREGGVEDAADASMGGTAGRGRQFLFSLLSLLVDSVLL